MGFMATLKAQKAYALHGKGQIKEALQMYEEAVKAGLDNPRFLLSYSVLLIRSGEYEKARDLLKKSEKVPGMNDEQKTQLFTNYAACMYRLGSLDKGINLLEKRALRAPNGMLYQTLGYLYCEKFDMNHVPDFEAIDAENMQKHAQAVEEVKAQAAAAGVEPSLPEPPTPARDAYLAQKERAQKFIEESIDYDDEDVGTLRHEVDLKGFIGYEKVSNKTLKLNFNDGDVIRVNVNPKKMASVIAKISNKDLRRQKICVKCF
jgi:tetratricopeptide (TPR) repeat protein